MLAMGEEWVVLVDEENRAVGTARKRDVHHGATPLHRGFSLFLFDRRGRTLLQQRARGKRTWPGVWSNACCGHPAPGETTIDAVHRRSREELGVAPQALELMLPDYRYRAEADGIVENELCPVLVARLDGEPPSPDPAEIEATRWVEWERFLAELPGDYSPWSVDEARRLAASPAFARWRAALTAGED